MVWLVLLCLLAAWGDSCSMLFVVVAVPLLVLSFGLWVDCGLVLVAFSRLVGVLWVDVLLMF